MLGHTEDFVPSALHNCYVIHADITDTDVDGNKHNEKFTSFCYPGSLPGYCMNVNRHGLVFTINTILPSGIHPNKTRKKLFLLYKRFFFYHTGICSCLLPDKIIAISEDSGRCAHDPS